MSVNYYNKTTGELNNIAGGGTGGGSELSKRIDISGSKNVVPYPYIGINTNTIFLDNGITYSVNSAREIIVSGTSSSEGSYCNIANVGEYLERNVPYVLSGCPSGGSTSSYYLSYENRASSIDVKDVGGSVEFTLTQGEDLTDVSLLKIVIAPNTTVTNLTFKPMIRLASIQDDTYYPYAKTNRELTENVNVIDGKTSSYDNSIYSLKAKTGFGAYYDSTKSYSVGEYVVQSLNGYEYIFKCTTACSAASWDVNKNNFTMTSLAKAVTELNSDLGTVKQSLIPSYQSLGESGVRGSGFVIKYDKVVILQIILKSGKAITANSSYRILELGASFRPSHSISQDGRLYQGADYRVTVNTSGNVDLYVAQSITVNNAQIAFTYLLE